MFLTLAIPNPANSRRLRREANQKMVNQQTGIEVIPNEVVGAEIRGVDLSKTLAPATFREIYDAWIKYSVIRIRDQQLAAKDQVAFSRMFGALDEAPIMETGQTMGEFPEIYVVSNVLDDNGKPIGSLGSGEAVWHTDMSYLDKPPKASSLYSYEIPQHGGGSTHFSNMYLAYATMPEALKKKIQGKRIKHDATHNSGGFLRAGAQHSDDPSETDGIFHPAVVTHPESKRQCLYLGRRPFAYVEGMSVADSETLLDELWAWVQQPQFAWEHQWQVGDLILWDNRCTLHRRDPFSPTDRRILHRTQIKGDAPPAVAVTSSN